MLTARCRESDTVARGELYGVKFRRVLGEQRFTDGIADDRMTEERDPTCLGNAGD